jgi:predicted sugar kinase
MTTQNSFLIKVGEVKNRLKKSFDNPQPKFDSVSIKAPYRLNAMALDPSLIAFNESQIYTPGEIVFAVGIYRNVKVKIRKDSQITINEECKRQQLVIHSVGLMRSALGITNGFDIEVDEDLSLKHSGLGSSTGIISSVAIAINELYGNLIPADLLLSYLTQNHGEEIDDNPNMLQHIQSIGGSAAASLVKAGMIVIAGESKIIATMNIDSNYEVVIAIPNGYKPKDSKTLAHEEMDNMEKFVLTGKKYAEKVAYELIHETLPAMASQDLKTASKVIFNYRFSYGSIENCSFVFPKITEIAKQIKHLFEDEEVKTLALSSVGPAFFCITTNVQKCVSAFEKAGLVSYGTKIHNTGYEVIEKI